MLEIPLVNGKGVALVDDIDADLALLPWYYTSGYAKWIRRVGRDYSRAWMHRVVLVRMVGALPPGVRPDHKNGNRLDNRRENLRPATCAQNALNAARRRSKGVDGHHTPFKGVTWDPHMHLWTARIQVTLGAFATDKAAASAYDEAARKVLGPFAWLNFPEDHDHE